MRCSRNKPATKIHPDALKGDVEKYPDAYQYERAKRLGVSQRGIGYALKRLGISRKKTLSPPQAEAAARNAFEQKIQADQQAPQEIIYVDESGFAHDMPRRYGYAPEGKRGVGIPNGHAKGRVNVIGALRASRLLTVSLFTGSIHAKTFSAWVVQD